MLIMAIDKKNAFDCFRYQPTGSDRRSTNYELGICYNGRTDGLYNL